MKIAQTVAEVLDQHVTLEFGVHRSVVSECVHAPATTRRRCGPVHPLPSEATVGLGGIDRANQPEVRGIDLAIYRREPQYGN